MSQVVFTHIPDEDLDCGELGSHPARFTAIIDAEQNRFGWSYNVALTKVTVDLVSNQGLTAVTIDVTSAFILNEYKRAAWEALILRDYQSVTNDEAKFDMEPA